MAENGVVIEFALPNTDLRGSFPGPSRALTGLHTPVHVTVPCKSCFPRNPPVYVNANRGQSSSTLASRLPWTNYTDELTGSFPSDVMKETECDLSHDHELELQAAEAFLAMGLRSFFLHPFSSMISRWCLEAVLPVRLDL
jgi:hypothetical protein